MTSNQIESTYRTIQQSLSNGRLKSAIDRTRSLSEELQWGELSDQLNDIELNYKYMLQYFFDGADDPQRKSVLFRLIARLFSLSARITEELLMRNATSYEYQQKRIFQHKLHFRNYNDLYDSIEYFHNNRDLELNDGVEAKHRQKYQRANYEKLFPDLFLIFWLTTIYQENEITLLNNILKDSHPGRMEKSIIISALTLNLWRMFDEEKLNILIDCIENGETEIRQRAMVGLCFVLTRYNQRLQFFPKIRNRLVLLTDDTNIAEQIKNIILIIIGTTETDQITRKMREEILPEMMKISPLLKDKMEEDNMNKPDDWEEENPAWRELLEESGIADKMQELTELQMEGADVYMSTFSILKNFPFFSEITNWFLPFDPMHSSVYDIFENTEKSILTAFMMNNAMCNSDKYSFCLSVMQMPLAQRDMLTRSFKTEADQMNEISKDEMMLNPTLASKNIAKQYIQDLFRFFRLFTFHKDFKSIFDYSLQIHRTSLYDILSSAHNFNLEIAEFYFAKNHYNEAIELYEHLASVSDVNASIYQKLGFAYQNNSNFESALEAYTKADMILPDDLWTLRKMALCNKFTGNYRKALETYQHIDFLKPGQAKNLMQIANCHLLLDEPGQALKIYFELDQKEVNNANLWRAIAWTSFVSCKLDQSEYYSEQVLEMNPGSNDWMNAGHIAWASGRKKLALERYRKAYELLQFNQDVFWDQLQNDKKHLLQNGIDPNELSFMADQLFMETHN